MSERPSGYAAFRSGDFRLFSASRFLSILALQMQNVAVGWLVYDLTRSAFALGLVGLAAFVPALSLVLVTGHVADVVDRRLVMLVAHVVTALSAAGLLAFALAGGGETWPVFALVALAGTARAFGLPAQQALLPLLVPREDFGNAVAWNSSVNQTATISGPAIGGVLYLLGPAVVFATVAACFAAAAVLAALIVPRPPDRAREKTSWTTLLAGLSFIRSRKVVLGAIALDLVAVFLGGATALLPVFAQDVLHVGPWGLGLLRSAPAVGALAMAFTLAHRPVARRSGRRMLEAVALFGIATVGFGLSTNLWLSLACLAVAGGADMVNVYVRQTLVQTETPDAMRGRVAAVNSIFIGASNELGEFESGTLAALFGAVPAVVIGGLATVAVAALWGRLFPELRDRDRLISHVPEGEAGSPKASG
ncbi:MAG TPA: MFS transporter [Beijerinckiaceae bacterium]|jgi:MFS family permease